MKTVICVEHEVLLIQKESAQKPSYTDLLMFEFSWKENRKLVARLRKLERNSQNEKEVPL